ncbi:MAG: hypothetical protein J6M02_04390 [Clostridia bacterium]|nr:hypothetical protein [Clostridia bacterium]
MAKIAGFSGSYEGLQKNEAWQRVYEYGRNCIPVRENRIQRAYMKIFRPKTKVIRDGVVQKIKTDYIVPGDNVIVEEGQFIPVDGKILAQSDFEVTNNLDGQKNNFVYQGAKVIGGRAIIEAVKTSDDTYTANIVKKIDGYNLKKNRFVRKIKKWSIGLAVITAIFAIVAFVFTVATVQTDFLSKILAALGAAIVLLILNLPAGFISAFASSLSRQCKKLKESGMRMKRLFSLPEAEKVTMICLEDDFLNGEYGRKINRLYEVGISIAVLTDKKIEEVSEKIQKMGICSGEIAYITKNELALLEEEDFRKVICENFVFCELDQKMKEKIILTFEELGVRCLASGYGLDSVVCIENADIGISRNHEKGSLDYELADATLYNNSFDALYEVIRQSFICSCSLKNYVYHTIVFQYPILLFILIVLLTKINIGELWAQGVLMIFAVIPTAMFLIEKNYSDSRLSDLKENKEKFRRRCIACIFIAILTVIVLLLECFGLIRFFGVEPFLSVNICFITFYLLVLATGFIEKFKFPYKGKSGMRKPAAISVESQRENRSLSEKTPKKEKEAEKERTSVKEEKPIKPIKEKPVKEKPAKKKDRDIGNEML